MSLLKKITFCLFLFSTSCGVKKSDRSESASIQNNHTGEDVIASLPKNGLRFQAELKNTIEANHIDPQKISDVEDEESKNTLSLILFLDD